MNTNWSYQYKMLAPHVKMIVINVAIFLLFSLVFGLFQIPQAYILDWFGMPDSLNGFLTRPWTIITYAFFHGGFRHILFNMITLYFSGNIFMNLFSGKRFYTVYLLGAIAGGVLYFLSYNIFPAFTNSIIPQYLIGASAAVMAILIFVCAYIPNQEVRVFMFNVKLWHVGIFFVLMDLLQISESNPGGHIAHLGGALLGFVYARQLGQGNDIGAWFSSLMDGIANLFSGKKSEKTKFKKVYRNKKSTDSSAKVFNNDKNIHQKKIDAILDKISKSGYESLSKDEKDYLFKAGKN
ncbi:Membrane associated serine protease, rhomboid family [Pustulibacterium marinum]|uniref:Membrane associated serine protease, rhomboid family n=2 Tax=Pustulibacterium marinum TaxID=1224947 RepID=A0A1I7H5R2_9FLAO|nr:Membrane associated serine protease, rhomboid family [Pustulibacterium marinum]